MPNEPGAIQFKLGDLGVAKLFSELDVTNTLADWMAHPKQLIQLVDPLTTQSNIYHVGLLLLQLAYFKSYGFLGRRYSAGHPRDMALKLPTPYSFVLEKALRRHVAYRFCNGHGTLARSLRPRLP